MTDAPGVVNAYFAALNSIDRAAFLDCFHSEAVARDPYGLASFEGQEGLNKFFDSMERTWRTFQMEPQAFFIAGDRVAVPWHTKATSKHGREATFEGVNVFTVDDDGKIRQLDAYWDFKAMLRQIRD